MTHNAVIMLALIKQIRFADYNNLECFPPFSPFYNVGLSSTFKVRYDILNKRVCVEFICG